MCGFRLSDNNKSSIRNPGVKAGICAEHPALLPGDAKLHMLAMN